MKNSLLAKRMNDCACPGSLRLKESGGYDHIWDAIPYYKLMECAAKQAEQCRHEPPEEIRACAERMVRANICACCHDEDCIIQPLVDEFVRKVESASCCCAS